MSFLKYSVSIVVLISITAVSVRAQQEKWIELPIDHDGFEEGKWQMRYFEEPRYYQSDGPIFIYINGEAAANPYPFRTCQVLIDMASETKGAMFVVEHRYYGKSMPLNNSVIQNLKYYKHLTISQVLMDIYSLITELKSRPEYANSKVALLGGSYAGNIAVWLKKILSDEIAAVWASSAPLQALANYAAYNEAVGKTYLQYGGTECIEAIKKTFKRYTHLLSSSDGIKQLKNEENICDSADMDREENQQLFIYNKIFMFDYYPQSATPFEIENHCSEVIAKANTINDSDNKEDIQSTRGMRRYCQDINFDKTIRLKAWFFQQCTELGYFLTTDSDDQPFSNGLPVEYFYKRCSATFGSDYDGDYVNRGVDKTNLIYGGKNPGVDKVVFTYAGNDPWRMLGVREDNSEGLLVKQTPGISHSRDMGGPATPNDPPELGETQEWVKETMIKWLTD